MRSRVRALSGWRSWSAWTALAGLTLAYPATAVHGQAAPGTSDAIPPVMSPAAPAEIQPGHPPPPPAGDTARTGPQSVVPTPLPPGVKADTPGGSARNGVIAPPGTPGGNPQVVPK